MSDPHPQRCPFCAIVAGDGPAREVLRTDAIVAFLPDVPAVRGHVLVVPAAHMRDIWDVDTRTGHQLADATRTVAAAVSAATGAEGLNIIQSNGEAAGQTVFHLHVHIVPRHRKDRMPELWPADAAWKPHELDSMRVEIATALRVQRYEN